MRINIRTLMDRAGAAYQSFATTRHDAASGHVTNAQVLLPLAETLRECEDEDPDIYSVDMEPGMALAIWRNDEGRSVATVILPEDGGGDMGAPENDGDDMEGLDEPVLYTLRNTRNMEGDVERAEQDGNIPLLAERGNNASIVLRLHSWLHSDRAHEAVDEELRLGLIGTLRGFVGEVAERTESMEFERTGLMMNVLESLRDEPVPEGLDRYLEMKLLRERIRVLDPKNEDASGASPAGMTGLLNGRGVAERAMAGITVRAPTGRMMVDDKMLRQAVRANDALCRQVFRPLTKTAVEDLAVGVLTRDDYDRLVEAFRERDEVLTGPWVDKAVEKMGTVVQETIGERYQYEIALASAEDRDVLLVREPAYGMHYFYSWATADRRPLLEIDGGKGIPTISPEEIPDAETIERLRGVWAALEERQLDQGLDVGAEGMAP